MSKFRYKEIANEIAQKIDGNIYQEGSLLPSERGLSDYFNVSRETVRKVIKLLEIQGYLVSRQGKGTFVTLNTLRKVQRHVEGFSDEGMRMGQKVGQQILFAGIVAAPIAVASSLGITVGKQVFRLHRIRTLDGLPVVIQDSYVNVDGIQRMTEEKIHQFGSLYRFLRESFGVVLTDAGESINAVLATGDECQLLGVKSNSPLLQIERIAISEDLQPIEFCVTKYAQSYSYRTVVRSHNTQS